MTRWGLKFSARQLLVPSVGVIAIAGALAFIQGLEQQRVDSTKLYDVQYPSFKNWQAARKSPYMLFAFRSPNEMIRIKGSVNQIEAEVNPTPELDANGLADYYMYTTEAHQKGWKAKELGQVAAKGVDFKLIEREHPDRLVINSFAVKGNTTLIVSLAGGKESKAEINKLLPAFKEYLQQIEFTPRLMATAIEEEPL